MRSKLYNVFYYLVVLFFRVINYNSKSIFVYTDSRGYDVLKKVGKNPFKSYLSGLVRNYRTTFKICPEKFTTIIDFLIEYQSSKKEFDYVILHCGIVDFSPRPFSNIEKVRESKGNNVNFERLFADNSEHHRTPLGPKYHGEELTTLYSKEYFLNVIAPQLREIKNLIWINSNKFVSGWEGNYTKGRPANISTVVGSFEALMGGVVFDTVDLKTWDDEDVKCYTIDNIHFTDSGFAELKKMLLNKLSH